MAQPIACDICGQEQAVQLLSNLTDGSQLAIGGACIPDFYAQSMATLLATGPHEGARTKCQACKVIHETMTGAVTPIGVAAPEGETEIPGQLTVDDATAEQAP